MSLVIESGQTWALVTGATGGLGQEFCKLLAARGYSLIITGRDSAKLARLCQTVPKVRLAFAGDLTDERSIRNLVARLKKLNIVPEVLVNNAGFGHYGMTLATESEESLRMIDLNVRVLTELTLEFARQMQQAQKGYILNVASIASFMPCPKLNVYAATKAYVLSFSEALHDELESSGVTVTALCPGPVKTGFWARAGVTEMESFNFTVMDSRKVAEYGLKALFAKRAVATCGFTNKMLTVAAQLAPRFLTRMVSRAMLDQLNRPPKKEDKKPEQSV